MAGKTKKFGATVRREYELLDMGDIYNAVAG
jgi:hypothetical protein